MSKFQAVVVPEISGSQSDSDIIRLEVCNKAGHRTQWYGSLLDGGIFTELYLSRPGIVRLSAAPALPKNSAPFSKELRGGPGLLVECSEEFVPGRDWVVAVETTTGCDPCVKYQAILGSSPQLGSSIYDVFVDGALSEEQSAQVQRLQLNGGPGGCTISQPQPRRRKASRWPN